MTVLDLTLTLLSAICIVSAIHFYHRERTAYCSLDKMLDRAIGGSFTENDYNETRLSALESKLLRYLSISKTSAQTVTEERKKLKELVSDISHQTKTPLSAVLLYTQLLQESPEFSDESSVLAKEIALQADKLNFLIEALVKTSRLETGVIRVQPSESGISEMLSHAVSAVSAKAAEKSISIQCSCNTDLSACFDPKWTEEALVNLLDNGIKYTPSGGSVTVSACSYELFCRIDIADTGCGIDEADIPRIFERFYRSPSAASKEGVGVGLYLARRILAAEGGYIKVVSDPGKGSVFSAFLPVDSREQGKIFQNC